MSWFALVESNTTGSGRQFLAAARLLTHESGLAGVTSSSEYYIATAAWVASRLGLSAPDSAAIDRCRHKDLQRSMLADAGIAVPVHHTADEVKDAVAAADEIGYPVVVKPTTGSGSVGVRLCADAQEVAAQAEGLLDDATDERGRPTPRLVLVEEYVQGAEFSVETFDREVIAVLAKHLGPAPHFVETGHDVPAPVPAEQRGDLGATAL